MNSDDKHLIAFYVMLLILMPIGRKLQKSAKRKVIKVLLTILHSLHMINLGACSYATLGNLHIDDIGPKRKLIWSKVGVNFGKKI